MLCKIILMIANVPECAAIYPVAVEMEQHIVCQMRVRPGRHISLYSAMQMRNLPDWRKKNKKILTISDCEFPGATFSLGVICFYSLLEARLLWRWRTLGQEENPLLFLKNMMLRQCRGTQCCRNRCEVDEMRCTYDNCSFFSQLFV